MGPRPFDEGDGNSTVLAALDGLDHPRIGERPQVALALQGQLEIVHGARYVGGQDELQVHRDLGGAGRRGGGRQGQGQGGEAKPERAIRW